MRARTSPLAFLVLVSSFLLVGCPGLMPKTFQESLAYAYGTHTAVLDAAAASVTAGDLSAEDGTALLALADQSRALLDAARLAYNVGDTSTAEGRLELAAEVLRQLQTYLRRKGVSP